MLVLTTRPREPDNHLLWEGLRQHAEVELHYVPKQAQRDLRALLKRFDLAAYDRVVLDLLFRFVSRHARLLRRVPGLVLYEEDACQEFIAGSKWRGRFSAFYRRVPHARVIFTGRQVAERFRALGVDACFLPKGYDSAGLYDEGRARDIELGFIGRLASDAYRERRAFLQRAERELGLQVMRTEPGDAYREALNRIRIFLSADIGLGEYMAKNFEAMACGCLLLAHRQGGGEEEALGLVDGVNAVLYGDFDEMAARLQALRAEPARAAEIARRGQVLAGERFDYRRQGERLHAMLSAEPREPAPRRCGWSWLRALTGSGRC